MDRLWYYTTGGKDQRGPVPEPDLRALIESGGLARSELVWTEGMAAWEPVAKRAEFAAAPIPGPAAGDAPTAAPAAQVVPVAAAVQAGEKPPAPFGGWLGFVGVMNILGGSLLAFTCVGIPMGILMILAGGALFGAKNALERIPSPPGDYAPVLAKFRTYFVLTGVLLLLHLAAALIILVNMSGMALMFSRMAESFK